MLHLYAALAEKQLALISRRTRTAELEGETWPARDSWESRCCVSDFKGYAIGR